MADTQIVTMVTSDLPQQKVRTQTVHNFPDVIIAVVSPLMAIFVRAAKTYINTLGGMLVAVPVSGMSPGDFWHTFGVAASFAIAPAVVSFVTNAGLLLSKLDQKFPTLQA